MSAESYVLVGTSVDTSPTPAMMNEAFRASGIAATYKAESIEANNLADFFRGCKNERIGGLNVTMPFKTEIVPLLDSVDERARKVGAVNTVKREASGYSGFNTDIDGIVAPLRALGRGARFRRGAVIGAGGAARAFVGAMHLLRCREIFALVRNPPRARPIFRELGRRFSNMTLSVSGMKSEEIRKLGAVDVVFNATPIGGDGARIPGKLFTLLKDSPVVFDAVYDPIETDLLREARRLRCPTVPGYEMLLSQGAAAFEIWTGTKAPKELMREALLLNLRVRTG